MITLHHTLDYIRNKIYDFKVCEKCGSLNWYENEYCLNCNSTLFRETSNIDLEYLNEEINEYGYNCELDV